MNKLIQESLDSVRFEAISGSGGGGCISSGSAFYTDRGKVFVKFNDKPDAELMFKGEKKGLEAIIETGEISAPKPYSVVVDDDKNSTSAALVTEFIDMGRLTSKQQSKLGQQLARMHLHNKILLEKGEKSESFITQSGHGSNGEPTNKFGFNVPTCCGYIAQDNTWQNSWDEFYIRQKLQPQVDMALEKSNDRKLLDIWPICLKQIESILSNLKIIPSLVHGDLWNGNIASNQSTQEPVIFDCASFFGHSEYDFGISHMFGGLSSEFFTSSYHSIIPKADGFSQREKIYELFHHLNHWNHFGSSYRGGTIRLMEIIINQKI